MTNLYRNTTNGDEYDSKEILDFCRNNYKNNSWIKENLSTEKEIIDYLEKNSTVNIYFWHDGKIEFEEIRLA